jgi:hypothetical protein
MQALARKVGLATPEPLDTPCLYAKVGWRLQSGDNLDRAAIVLILP